MGHRRTCYHPVMLAAGTISVQFFETAVHCHDRVALQTKREGGYVRWLYGEIADQVHRLATFLRRLEIAPGDRVALFAENRPEWCVAYLGIVAAGATAVPLDAQLGEQELESVLRHSESRAVVVSEAGLTKVHPLVARLPLAPEVILLDAKAAPGVHVLAEILKHTPKDPLPAPTPEGIASILYTSGTTGTPKGVMLSHRNFLSNFSAVRELKVCGPEDNLLALLPLHHVYPFMISLVTPLLCGARVTFLQSLKPPDLLACMRETGVTILVGVPQLLALLHRGIFQEVNKRSWPLRVLFDLLLGLAGAAQQYLGRNTGRVLFPQIHRRFGGRLRVLTSGGAKLEPAVGRDLCRLGFTVLEGYGLTETSPVVTFSPADRPRYESVGVPLPGVRVRIMEPDPSGVGEIAVQGPNVMHGYFKDPEGTAQSFRDGWFLSGDLGYLDGDGYLYIAGRLKEVIVLPSGKNIYPEDVEADFLKSPFIKEICLVGTEEPAGGLTALVVPNFEHLKAQRIANVEDTIRWDVENVSRNLPAYKRPTRLHIVKDAFPRTRLGKIQRHLVRQMYLQEEVVRADVDEGVAPSETDQALWESPVTRTIITSLPVLTRKKQGIRLDDNLELDLGLDSLSRIELLVALEESFGIDLPADTGPELFTVRDVVRKVQECLGEHAKTAEATRAARRPPWSEILAGEPPEAVQAEIAAGKKPWALFVTFLSRALLHLVFRLFCRLRVHGFTHVPDRGPYLITPNHASYVDAFALGVALPLRMVRHLHFLGFQQFFQNPVSAMFGRAFRVIHVDAEAYLFQALRAAAHVLRQGETLCIFPEGARSIDGEIKPFKKGGAILAKELNLPLLPTRIIGSFEIWPRGRRLPRPHPLVIIFGPPVTVEELLAQEPIPPGADLYQVIAARLRDRVAALAAE
ncbi:MAG: AMP-binding protein [Candidatus Methylomirabilales bacterium]